MLVQFVRMPRGARRWRGGRGVRGRARAPAAPGYCGVDALSDLAAGCRDFAEEVAGDLADGEFQEGGGVSEAHCWGCVRGAACGGDVSWVEGAVDAVPAHGAVHQQS